MLILSPARADAGMHFCNKTSLTVNVAMATISVGDMSLDAHVWGWWQVQPGGCKTPIGADLDTSGDVSYYYYGYDASGGTWSDTSKHYSFCIDPNDAFDYNDSEDYHCASGQRRNFREILYANSRSDYTVNLTE